MVTRRNAGIDLLQHEKSSRWQGGEIPVKPSRHNERRNNDGDDNVGIRANTKHRFRFRRSTMAWFVFVVFVAFMVSFMVKIESSIVLKDSNGTNLREQFTRNQNSSVGQTIVPPSIANTSGSQSSLLVDAGSKADNLVVNENAKVSHSKVGFGTIEKRMEPTVDSDVQAGNHSTKFFVQVEESSNFKNSTGLIVHIDNVDEKTLNTTKPTVDDDDKGGDNSLEEIVQIDKGGNESTEKTLEIHLTIDDEPIFEAPVINPETKDFDPNINAVIVTKIHGSVQLRILRQMLCLLTKAYNNRVNHDIIIFTSEKINETDVIALQQIVSPAKLVVEIDNPGLHKMVNDLSPSRKKHLLDRCNVGSTEELSWFTKCSEVGSFKTFKSERIAYNWQAEFRALWLWTHPFVAPYKYMMWIDSDVFCSRVWNEDPIAAMERHDLALLFDHFPQGAATGKEFPQRAKEAFDKVICDVSMVNGTLVARDGNCLNRKKSRIKQVHGFFHVSSLDFYRSDAVMKWNRALIGDSKFSRLFDDQIGITMPAAVLAGNRSRDMRSLGVYPRVFHNFVLDGRMEDWRGYFKHWWRRNANTSFPEANGVCHVTISG
mmetsp:Transcript_23875/g.52801  ORF Transcript_23875/g.52801 Transcript_23875/m.52801 type:complete len:599 (+) Transcript_23875:234-2030(+)|eukprot:CAMPEP_0201133262 /NCGR_PEP_ID=MMETSP0850-20130426/48260_1 /ASSEMBLY_ACC=CAM_ASM_000622 /TAXON_ID=183588 /ORGANISM="Pseudo-nitzschia fraudulenta, Strain WWA7" /LENGTH=598 /DNA_ID=CAMNT_0047403841 /DNA_START=143 /DNA_END=1939 /DNA_ORIENTATION=-